MRSAGLAAARRRGHRAGRGRHRDARSSSGSPTSAERLAEARPAGRQSLESQIAAAEDVLERQRTSARRRPAWWCTSTS